MQGESYFFIILKGFQIAGQRTRDRWDEEYKQMACKPGSVPPRRGEVFIWDAKLPCASCDRPE